MKKFVLYSKMFFLFGWSCTDKKTFNIPNGNYPEYKSGDTLIFEDETGHIFKWICTFSEHRFKKETSSGKDYSYEIVSMKFKPLVGKGMASVSVSNNLYVWIIPPGYSDSTQFVLNWDNLSKHPIHHEFVLGNTYEKVVNLSCDCPKPDNHKITFDLKKGLLTFFDSTGTLWQFKEKRPKL